MKKLPNPSIGLYGGTFNPIHNGHLHLALSLLEIHHLKEVWFLPTLVPPLKQEPDPAFYHRAIMAQIAIDDVPKFRLEEIEKELPAPSFTIQTIQFLKKRYPTETFALLLGEDAAETLPQWKEVDQLIQLVTLLIGSRKQQPSPPSFQGHPQLSQAIQTGWTPIPCLDISSSRIRERIQKGLFCRHLVPSKVMDYIYVNNLY